MKDTVNHQALEDEAGTIPPPKDLMFNPWLTLAGEDLKDLSERIVSEALDALSKSNRPPRRDLVLNVTDIVPCILANLLVLLQDRPQGSRLVVPMAKLKITRYDRQGFHKFPAIVKVMIKTNYLQVHDATYKQKRTTVEPTDKLKAALIYREASPANIALVEGEEVIQLSERPEEPWRYGRKQPNELRDYKDTHVVHEMRKEMLEVNAFLNSFSINLQGQPSLQTRLVRRFLIRSSSDPESFDLHGRLYGGFWEHLKSTERHRIRINGEPVSDLDFDSMFPRLAYHQAGRKPPRGDLYKIHGLENHRKGAKAGFSALLSHSSMMRRLPSSVKDLLPEGWTASRLKEAVALAHPYLVPLFGKDLGLDLMFTESRILLAALSELRRQGIPALPMHDGMMVPVSKSSLGAEAMRKASKKVRGHELPVSLKDANST